MWFVTEFLARCAKYCDLCVGLSVLPVHSHTYLKNHTSRLRKSFFGCYLWLRLGPPSTTMQYVMYFQFCGCLHLQTVLSPLVEANAFIRRVRCIGIVHCLLPQCNGRRLHSLPRGVTGQSLLSWLPCCKEVTCWMDVWCCVSDIVWCVLKSALLSLGELPMISHVVTHQAQSLIDALLRVSISHIRRCITTATAHLTALCPGQPGWVQDDPGWAGTRKRTVTHSHSVVLCLWLLYNIFS